MVGIGRLLLVARPGPLADGLSVLLRTIPGVEGVDRVEDLPPALAMMSEPGPTVVVLDSRAFAEQTPAMVRRLEVLLPESRCLVLADNVGLQRAAEGAGADAVLLKGCRPADLVATVGDLLLAKPAPPPRVPRPARARP